MPIHSPSAPPEAANAVRAAMSSLLSLPEGVRHIRALAQEASVGVSELHPIYVALPQDIVDKRVLAAAQLTGWRSIISKNEEPLAAVESDSSVNEGPFVSGTVDAVRAAETRFAESARDYEMRLLRIPAVYAVALWLHAEEEDVLIPLAPAPAPLRANEPIDVIAFTEALRPMAQSRLTSPDPTAAA